MNMCDIHEFIVWQGVRLITSSMLGLFRGKGAWKGLRMFMFIKVLIDRPVPTTRRLATRVFDDFHAAYPQPSRDSQT
jgi:hypothetical protein